MLKTIFIICILFAISITSNAQKVAFTKGVNLSTWFQTNSAGQIQFNKFSIDDLINIKSLGCDVIRLPLNLHYMTNGAPSYTLNPLFFYFLDKVVTWAEELQIHLILDNHSFDPTVNTSDNVDSLLIPIWKQMAEHYKNRNSYILYEILNEPHGITDVRWNQIQQAVVDTIRTIDKTHTLVIGGANWNGYNNLSLMPIYNDTNLIYTFHFYDPMVFTHQGANWVSPSMIPLKNVPYPYDAATMPACPTELVGSWINSSLDYYYHDGTSAWIKQLLDIAINFSKSRNVPIFCGEFGTLNLNSDTSSRARWLTTVHTYLEQNNVPWTLWEYKSGFGIFEKNSNEFFNSDICLPLTNALGFTAPTQQAYIQHPDSSGFMIYDDLLGAGIVDASWLTGIASINYYSDSIQHDGDYCIELNKANLYNFMDFDFQPNKDLSYLTTNNAFLSFWIKTNSKNFNFDLRFTDTKTADTTDHPWRMTYTISQSKFAIDGQWHHLQIPLTSFTEQGSWDDAWFNPVGKFDWKAVNDLSIAAERQTLNDDTIWFDNIEIIDKTTTINEISGNNSTLSCYPNPFKNTITIQYQLNNEQQVQLNIIDITGKTINTLINTNQAQGNYSVAWNGLSSTGIPVSKGIYILQLKTNNAVLTQKIIK